jgi:uncharacterized protein
MPNQPAFSRRHLLQLLAGAPMLPIASTFAGCSTPVGGDGAASSGARFDSATFSSMPAPTLQDAAAMATMHVAGTLELKFSDNSVRTHQLAYQPFFMTGDMVSDGRGGQLLAGGYYDINGRPIMDKSVAGQERQFFSDCVDGSSLLKLDNASVPGVKGNAVFAVVQFEYTTRNQAAGPMYGLLPSPIAVLTLDQDPATGKLSLVKYANVDTSGVKGLWITCGASLSPWNTHLSSEEYEPDATAPNEARFRGFSQNLFGSPDAASPYDYGHLPEVTVRPDGTGSIAKHYCVGRLSHELVHVAPDERTVLMGDDWSNGGAFMFIADKPRDLSSGTLYVARWNQTSGAGPGAATLDWIRLGHASSAEIKALVAGGIKAGDIMDVKKSDPNDARYTKIPYAGGFNWVQVMPGMDKAAAFLETHRYAALKGGSMGFTKWEGTCINSKDKVAYVAMSRIETPMTNGSGHVKVEGPYSGAVYAQNLKGGRQDTHGAAIPSEWVPVDMAAVPALISEDLGGGKLKQQDAIGNFAHPDKIATPDNLKFSERLRTLFIGEDSNTHVNNFLWAYHVDTKQLRRILSTPAGAESTGLHAVDEINGWSYIVSAFQHAGDWESPLHDKVKGTLAPLIAARYKNRFGASMGYLTARAGGIRLKSG